MAFKRYDPKTKEAIMKAATEARAVGKTWAEAHTAAKTVGYKGSPEGLDVMIRNAKGKGSKLKASPVKVPIMTVKATEPSTKTSKSLNRYGPKVKAAIAQATTNARNHGKTWVDAHSAAKDAGYKGSVQGLVKMMQAGKKKAVKAKVAAPKMIVATPKSTPKPASAGKTPPADGYDPVHAMIDQIVKQKVKAVVEKAIAELKKAVE